jgi:hypothetical protein
VNEIAASRQSARESVDQDGPARSFGRRRTVPGRQSAGKSVDQEGAARSGGGRRTVPGLVWRRLPVGYELWLVCDESQDGVSVGLVAKRLLSRAPGTYDVVVLDGARPWVSEGHPTVSGAVAELAEVLAKRRT